MSDTSTKRAEEIAYNLQLSGVSGSTWRATEVDASNMLRALAAERDALRANLDAIIIPTTYYMDPPDGGDVSIAEQVSRMYRHVCDLQAETARLREMLSKTTKILVAAFNRIHGLPRTTDTELSTEIEKCLGEIRRVREETQ